MAETAVRLTDPCSQRAVEACGNEERFALFAGENRRFILACAYRAVNRFVTESDDEWSVALGAFYEAVRSYDAGKGEFRPFAAMVIRRRVLDWRDREARRAAG